VCSSLGRHGGIPSGAPRCSESPKFYTVDVTLLMELPDELVYVLYSLRRTVHIYFVSRTSCGIGRIYEPRYWLILNSEGGE
jgi:hypothetical protein